MVISNWVKRSPFFYLNKILLSNTKNDLILLKIILFILIIAFLAKTFIIVFWFGSALDFYYNWSAGVKYLVTFMPNTSLKYVQHVINQYERSSKLYTI